MLYRIVRLHFRPETLRLFLDYLPLYQEAIRASEGCLHLRILQDRSDSNLIFTYSLWREEADLERYRHSELFRSVWSQVRLWFAEPAQAWSLDPLVEL